MNSKSRFAGLTAALVGASALVPMAAFATPTATFDTAPILADITEYAGYAMVLVVAFIGARWGLRALGLIGHK